MNEPRSNKSLILTSILLAITSSLCCILPILSIFGAIGGFASSLSWLEPARAYLMTSTVLILGFAFYQAYKPKKVNECGCSIEERKSLMSSKKFLWSITIVSVLLMSFPYYSSIFNKSSEKRNISIEETNLMASTLHIEGMTCKACEGHVNNALLKQQGVFEATSNYEEGLAYVKFDKTKISVEQLASTTQKETGYTVKP